MPQDPRIFFLDVTHSREEGGSFVNRSGPNRHFHHQPCHNAVTNSSRSEAVAARANNDTGRGSNVIPIILKLATTGSTWFASELNQTPGVMIKAEYITGSMISTMTTEYAEDKLVNFVRHRKFKSPVDGLTINSKVSAHALRVSSRVGLHDSGL